MVKVEASEISKSDLDTAKFSRGKLKVKVNGTWYELAVNGKLREEQELKSSYGSDDAVSIAVDLITDGGGSKEIK